MRVWCKLVPQLRDGYVFDRRHARRAVAILLLICLMATTNGCIGLVPSPFRPSPGPQTVPQIADLAEAFDVVCRNYRLGPDDVIRAIFQPEWNIPTGSYRLDTLDEIAVKFIVDPQLNEQVVIRPDGMITLQAIGDVRAAGLTPEELAKKIRERFLAAEIFSSDEAKRELKNYRLVTVHVVSFFQKLKKLVESLTTLVGGQQTEILVKPDGTVDFPLLRDRILASGYTVAEVENTVNRVYNQGVLKHAVISLSVKESKSRKVYVLGQVNKPGAYDIKQPITALHALALAEGHIQESADLTSVILITKNIYGKPAGRRLDLKRLLDVGDVSSAIMVKPYDVLFVPSTYIRDLNMFMEQYFGVVKQVKDFLVGL
jgi:polysaccharide biosynthesis/export protein